MLLQAQLLADPVSVQTGIHMTQDVKGQMVQNSGNLDLGCTRGV